MVVYLKPQEIHKSLSLLVVKYIEDCEKTQLIPQDFVELIRHNFSAKFAWYNPLEKTIEIGVNEPKIPGFGYPQIKVYSYPINQTTWMERSFKFEDFDLSFYGKLLNGQRSKNTEIVVL